MAAFLGSIYFNDENTFTVMRFKNKETVRIKNNETGEMSTVSIADLISNYTMLEPHAFLSFNIVTLSDTVRDIIVSMYRDSETNKPYCVCRQCITDLFANNISINRGKEYYGISISEETCPADVDYSIMIACNGIQYSEVLAVYRTYTLDDILSFINIKKYDAVLDECFRAHVKVKCADFGDLYTKAVIERENCYEGFCRSIKDLLELNNFMYDFYRCFNIYPLDLNLKAGEDLKGEEIAILSDILCTDIIRAQAQKYDLSIDLTKCMQGNRSGYVLIKTREDLFIVFYISTGSYRVPVETIESPDNILKLNKIMTKANIDNAHIRTAYDKIMFNNSKYNLS